MPLVRMLVSWKAESALPEDTFTNTLYFNVSGSIDPPNYQTLADDLRALYMNYSLPNFTAGRRVTVKAYDMSDQEPRPVKATSTATPVGSLPGGATQVAVGLSYYADRNLPRQRGRIFTGPWANSTLEVPTTIQNSLKTMATGFFALGGLNVDWSLWSPTTQTATRINHGWIDNSWDIIRSRKIKATNRLTFDGNG